MIPDFVTRISFILIGTLYPMYRSYKALNKKDLKEYMKWLMYWIVFALFSFVESIVDIFLTWLPFYNEFKLLFLFYLLCPWTMGSSILYRKLVHPWFLRHEKEIEGFFMHIKRETYKEALNVGAKSILLAKDIVTIAAVNGQTRIWNQINSFVELRNRGIPMNMTRMAQVSYIDDIDEEQNLYEDTPTLDDNVQFDFNMAFISADNRIDVQQPQAPEEPDDGNLTIEFQDQPPPNMSDTPLKPPDEEQEDDVNGDVEFMDTEEARIRELHVSGHETRRRRGRPPKSIIENSKNSDIEQLLSKRDRKRINSVEDLNDSTYGDSHSIGTASTLTPQRRVKPKNCPRRKRAHKPAQRVLRKRPGTDDYIEFETIGNRVHEMKRRKNK